MTGDHSLSATLVHPFLHHIHTHTLSLSLSFSANVTCYPILSKYKTVNFNPFHAALGMKYFSLKGLIEEGSFTGDPGRYVKKALDMDISLYRGPTGEPGGDSLAGTFEQKG